MASVNITTSLVSPPIDVGSLPDTIGSLCGHLSAVLFTVVYFPQIAMHYRHQSTRGFSASSIMVKIIGGAFYVANTAVVGERSPVIAGAVLSYAVYVAIIAQVAYYFEDDDDDDDDHDHDDDNLDHSKEKKKDKRHCLAWRVFLVSFPVAMVVFALCLGFLLPETLSLTSTLKPATQIGSHFLILSNAYRIRSTRGISLSSQHLNFLGAVLGAVMCYIRPPISFATYFYYYNSMGQAVSLYMLAAWFHGAREVLAGSAITSWMIRKKID